MAATYLFMTVFLLIMLVIISNNNNRPGGYPELVGGCKR